MNFLRNTLGVLVGLFIAGLIITLGIRLNPDWISYQEFAPFEHWRRLLISVQDKEYFFVALLVFSGLGAMVGGVATALIVKYAKVAYAILIGFILLFIAVLDIIIFPYHPTFYQIIIFLVFFPSSWVGGKVVEVVSHRIKRRKQNKRNR